jgi:glycosyltransferase involved in cell wall biosynthesis
MQFSIIIPAKNELENFKRNLHQFESLRGKYTYEVIIADGASTDGSIEYARGIADRVEVKTKQGKETIAEARNNGARVAAGDIFAFFDAAVQVDAVPSFFEYVLKRFEDPDIVAVIPRVGIYPDEATRMDKVVSGCINFLIRFCNVMGWGAGKGEAQIIRRSAFEKVHGYNELLVAAEDNDMMRRLARIGKVVSAPSLNVYDDPRRYRKLGYPRVIAQWILNQLSVIFFGKSYSKEWKRVD